MNEAPRFMVLAGEVSGDMHAAGVVRGLRARCPGAEFFGMGGPRMREAGVATRYDIEALAVMGFVEVLKRFGFFRQVFHTMLAEAAARRPDAVIFVDYPGFNLRFAARTRALSLRNIYYIAPQVWAWNRRRIPRMAAILDGLVTIFPFEPACFAGTGLPTVFAGHPLVDETRQALAAPPAPLPWLDGAPPRRRLALLPGSRVQEIRRILPPMLHAARRLEHDLPGLTCLIASPSPAIAGEVEATMAATPNRPTAVRVVAGQTREVLRQARAALVASGTATLETALMGCPCAVVYRTSPLTYLAARHLVEVDHIGMVNIVAGRRLCPEFVQDEAEPVVMATALLTLMDESPERAAMLAGYAEVTKALGEGNAGDRAAAAILEMLR